MNYKAAIFDLDGTLLNTLDDLRTSVNISLIKYDLEPKSEAEVAAALGNGYAALISALVPEKTDSFVEKAVLETFKETYAQHSSERTAPYTGVIECLRSISDAGLYRAVVSNKGDEVVQNLVPEYFPGTFNAVVGERPGVRRKPCPDSLFAVMRELDVEAKDVVYIGDSEVDVECARQAGVDCIAVSWGFRTKEELTSAGATTIVDTPEELLEAIDVPILSGSHR